METKPTADEREPWVRRLRDGQAPPVLRIVTALLVLSATGALTLWLEALHPEWVRRTHGDGGRGSSIVFVPLVLLLCGMVGAVVAWLVSRQDRRTLQRIREAGVDVAFHLPVATTSTMAAEQFAEPEPVIWTVDDVGLHGWGPDHRGPVHELPWAKTRRIDVATRRWRGQDADYGIRIDTDHGHVVLEPRSGLCRPSRAGQDGLAVLTRVLRALRDRAAPLPGAGGATGDTPLGAPAAPTG
ncbi:hypothetical protein [Curtobacterium sp. MCBD17_032]|uniref:hypothetical protein n=1 Tax=Curtobacterium sp. MCBD17_032 TaxID=2175659 RepID=UPI0015E8B23C|nr:hypothetical protein [Curtobacterium sp. MCBD17_032]